MPSCGGDGGETIRVWLLVTGLHRGGGGKNRGEACSTAGVSIAVWGVVAPVAIVVAAV